VTVGDWLDARSADVPAPLVAGVREALGPAAERPAHEAADALLEAAAARLAELLPEQVSSRGGAVPLLVVDALTTFALEAAAGQPDELDARTRRAMLQLAALA
jgi:hypothetical protein